MPNHPDPSPEVGHPEGAGGGVAAEIRAASGVVDISSFADTDIDDRLPCPQRDLAIGTRETPVEAVGQVLCDDYRTIGFNLDLNVGFGQAELLCLRRGRYQ
jgi:hypothetical protein